jgi:hypothetical protein
MRKTFCRVVISLRETAESAKLLRPKSACSPQTNPAAILHTARLHYVLLFPRIPCFSWHFSVTALIFFVGQT